MQDLLNKFHTLTAEKEGLRAKFEEVNLQASQASARLAATAEREASMSAALGKARDAAEKLVSDPRQMV